MNNSAPDFSIVICSYDSEEEIFSRTLTAVQKLEIPAGSVVECIIVDNNNSPPLADRAYIQRFLSVVPWARIIVERELGHAFARNAGINSTCAPVIIFFDDDNEPANDYLVAANRCLELFPCVFAWGPGKTTAEFYGKNPKYFHSEFASIFQEREFEHVEYGCVPAKWENYYPYGTGIILRREVLVRYAKLIHDRKLTLPGRKGNKLSSGDDSQIVWEAVKMGRAAGVCPDLRMTHLISSSRLTSKYIARLIYGTGSSYMPALVESFPDEQSKLRGIKIRNIDIVKVLAKILVRATLRLNYKNVKIEFARYLGPLVGIIDAKEDSHGDVWIRKLAKSLELE